MKIHLAKFAAVVIALVASHQLSAQDVVATNFPKKVEVVKQLPPKQSVWIFVLAGQSNMAGRGIVEPQDTIPDPRILTIDKQNQIVLAKEPLHYYEPTRTGLDCGLSFARTLLKSVPKNVTILLVPTAVGGSSIQQWLGDSTYRNVKLLTNARQKIAAVSDFGVFKGVLWHQGESNANNMNAIGAYREQLARLVGTFRTMTNTNDLPFLVGELKSFAKTRPLYPEFNKQLALYVSADNRAALIKTDDLVHKGDYLHFDGPSLRIMGQRFASTYVERFSDHVK